MVESVQYVRAFAALAVLGSHVIEKLLQTGYLEQPIDGFDGRFGVDLFFVVSGYVMCLTTATADRGRLATVAEFTWRRFSRIYPLYWALTLAALAIWFMAPGQVNQGGGTVDVIASLTLVPTDEKLLVKNGWTLTYELYFYVVFGLSLALSRRNGHLLVVSAIALPVLWPAMPGFDSAVWRMIADPIVLEFLMGMGLYTLHRHLLRQPFRGASAAGALLVGVALATLVANDFAMTESTRHLDYGLPAFALCLGMLLLEPLVRRYPVPGLRALGDLSYSLYLSHPFVLAAQRALVNALPESVRVPGWLFATSMVAGSLVVAYLTYVLIEDVAQKWLRGAPRRRYLVVQHFWQWRGDRGQLPR